METYCVCKKSFKIYLKYNFLLADVRGYMEYSTAAFFMLITSASVLYLQYLCFIYLLKSGILFVIE